MKKKGEYNPEETGGLYGTSIAFGIINLVLVGICFLIRLVVVSAGLALFFLLAFYAVFLEIKDGITEKDMKGLAKGLLGFAINVAALILYFYNLKLKYFGI